MNKGFVTLEQNVCPACGKAFDTGALLFDRRLRERFDMKTVTGMSLCPEDQQKVDEGYRILVEIDLKKSTGTRPQDVHRTGPMAYVRAEVADELMPSSKGFPVVWVEPGVMELLREQACN